MAARRLVGDENRVAEWIQEAQSHSARDVLSEVVNRVSTGEERSPTDLRHSASGLRFSQLRRTSSKGDPHPLPGIRRLE